MDNDGLIEISSLTELHNMRYDLAGTSYKTTDTTGVDGNSKGCDGDNDGDGNGDGVCFGYELRENLDFDFSGDGRTWLANGDGGHSLHEADSNAVYFPVADGGWLPIGSFADPFAAVFDGNGRSISNLAIRRDQSYVGLFGFTSGAVIRNIGLVDNLADHIGSNNRNIYIGGLVGLQSGGSITASYATGPAAGGDGGADRVGGLVGRQDGGSITASYATGPAAGGDGISDFVGGLVGYQNGGMITASYATGPAAGGDGATGSVGGLVGFQDGGSITASYATGAADGGGGGSDAVGGLVGTHRSGSITASYGFGRATGEVKVSAGPARPEGVETAAQLTAANVAPSWNDASSNTLDAWSFGGETQIPALNYADYDGITGTVFVCIQFPADVCDPPTLLPGQDEASVSGPSSALKPGATAVLTGSLAFGRVSIESWSWQQLAGPEVALSDATASVTTFTAPATRDSLVFELTATDSDGRRYRDLISLAATVAADNDGNGLIEIYSLLDLHNMRYNLAGTSYKASADSAGDISGCPTDTDCRGYELVKNLDFDEDDDGSTWSGSSDEGYRLDQDDSHADYFPVADGGWLPVGNAAEPFVAVFDGNGHRIRNLAIRRDQTSVGLFGAIGGSAAIRNLGLIDNLADYTGISDDEIYIGGLVGRQSGGLITASHATGPAAGGDGNKDAVGGLVGVLLGGSITASYATGVAAGGDGDDDVVGGLVGFQSDGSITASYATGAAAVGAGGSNSVGGLVGLQNLGSITASYATGAAAGGDGDFDEVGGLVGWQLNGSITASYATGAAAGGAGSDDVGGLVGRRLGDGSTTASYGFGQVTEEGRGLAGSEKPPRVSTAAQLTAANAGSSWDDAGSNTLGVWDFGTEEQIPALKYADYDGDGTVFVCGPDSRHFPADACGTLLPGQGESFSAGGPPAAGPGDAVELVGSFRFDGVSIASWSWQQLAGPEVALSDATASVTTFTAPATRDSLVFELTATASDGGRYTSSISLAANVDADNDGDGLIEIYSLIDLHNMRHNLAGTSYSTSTASVGSSSGCPVEGEGGCWGYELMQDLDFDGDGDGGTWSGNGDEGFRLDRGDSQADYFPVDEDGAGGWLPIGDEDNPFAAVFDGNSHTISNLAIRRSETFYVGLFGRTGAAAVIRNIGLVDNLADYSGSSNNDVYIGGLVGLQSGGSITVSYATGPAAGGDGDLDSVGGLVGLQEEGGSITASYATGAAAGGAGDSDSVGGLVGWQSSAGSITASYATGAAVGGDGDNDFVGGLVGYQEGGSITASYATGAAVGGDGDLDYVGGLVGWQFDGSITASYATGAAVGGDGDDDYVGGLVGYQDGGGMITASYATGPAAGGDGDDDYVGGLVGLQFGSSITASHGFGGATGEISAGSTKPPGVDTAAQLTADNAGSSWDDAGSNTLGAWDFGTETQIPALKYADYDGITGTVFVCGPNSRHFPANVCGTLLPGQDEASVSGPSSALEPGATVSLAGSPRYGRIGQFASFSWRQLAGPGVAFSDAAAQTPTFTAPEVRDLLVFELTATAGDGREYRDRISLGVDVDRNDNGLIEIDSQLDLHYMRYNLKGTSYKTSSTTSVGNSFGCPDRVCKGYELMQDLDFDGDDDDGGTWSVNDDGGYTLDSDDHQADYFPVASGAGGWLPIGNATNPFVTVFDGNSHTISNLAIRRSETFYVGLFGRTGAAAVIRNIGLVDNLADYSGSSNNDVYIGGLVGSQFGGSITASYATGPAAGGDGEENAIGGLVGSNTGGSITASYATGPAAGGDGEENAIGGLVGSNTGGSITASYATGPAAGGDGDFDYVGGLVGWQSSAGSITASYATGVAAGGDGDEDSVGGLVGRSDGFITASYATGSAAGGDGDEDYVGGLVGRQTGRGSITASYGFGALSEGMSVTLGIHPTLTLAVQLTAENAGSSWDDAGSNTLGAWDFGDEKQNPALKYADYDGGGDVFNCDHFPVDACDTLLLPGQRGGTDGGGGGGGTDGGGGGTGDGGGGGSLGPGALVVLALPFLPGRRRLIRGSAPAF